jgi:acetone carboxylase gamma subunit
VAVQLLRPYSDLGATELQAWLLVAERDPSEVHPPIISGEYTFAPDPNWVRILEFYCPSCGRQVETEYLPPGHPITVDIEVDIDSLKRRLTAGELIVRGGKLVPPDAREGARP